MHAVTATAATAVPLKDALTMGIEFSRAKDAHKSNQFAEVEKLVAYFGPRLGDGAGWNDLKKRHIHEFVRNLEQRELSPSYIRLAVNPIRLASKYMSTIYDEPPLQIDFLPARVAPTVKWLTVGQVVRLWTCAKAEGREDASILVLLMGLAGLRLTEANRLHPECLKGNELWVNCDVKNEASRRVIPLPLFVADCLREYWESGQELSPRRDTVGNQVRKALRAMAEDCEDPAEASLYAAIAPKDLRKTMPNTLAAIAPREYIAAYIGHTPKYMLERHYQARTPKPDAPEMVRKQAIADLQRVIVEPIETLLSNLALASSRW